jgi:5-(carboxyamino)imidazole ribonucleotide synthase
VADREVTAPYEDTDAIRAFVKNVDVLTFEFENVPASAVQAAEALIPVRPGGSVLHTTQHRLREKTFLSGKGFPVTPFHAVHTAEDLPAGLARVGLPAVMKTAGFGYDGKGQRVVRSLPEAQEAFKSFQGQEALLEAFVDFQRELSVVAARGVNGAAVHYGVIENMHRRHILDLSVFPADLSPSLADQAVEMAQEILKSLDVVGVLCVELFLTRDNKLLVNELAPRPHNSGHLTVDAAVTSQFEQQLRAVCGLPLGSTDFFSAAAMANLLGDLWEAGEPEWIRVLALPSVKLHLYGKQSARPGRKMGHLTALAPAPSEARETALKARRALGAKD